MATGESALAGGADTRPEGPAEPMGVKRESAPWLGVRGAMGVVVLVVLPEDCADHRPRRSAAGRRLDELSE